MAGAINFAMSDIYGGVWGTTEETIPEASDQQALVDDEKMAQEAKAAVEKKRFPMAMTVVVILVLVILFGVVS